jgi:hypothetical protein
MGSAHYVSNFYYRIALQNQQQYECYMLDIEKLSSCEEEDWMKDMKSADWHHQGLKSAVQSIVFSAMCLEAFIYDYSVKNLGSSYTKKHIEKLNIESKFIIVPRLIAGKEIQKSGQGYEMLKKLISDRNKIVHFKAQEDFFQVNSFLPTAMANGLAAIKTLMLEFEEIHPEEKYYFRAIPVMAECFA